MAHLNALRVFLAAALAGTLVPAFAFEVSIHPAPLSLFLQVGAGSMTGGTFSGGGTPQDNGTINLVSGTVAASALGNGVAVALSSNSTVANSPYDGRAFCSTPSQVYVGGFHRRTAGGNVNATLSVTTPASLTNASSDTIPFSEIAWTSGGTGDATPTIPSGTFTGGTQTLLLVGRNTWFESCLAFRFLNTTSYAPGTFTGRATYTLTAP